MSVAAPATNPASDLELKLPATIGTANQYLKNSSTAGTLEFGTLSAGKILQVLQVVKKDTTSETSSTYADISGMTINITPSASSSKILFIADLSIGHTTGNHVIRMIRDSTDIYSADAASSRPISSGGTNADFTNGGYTNTNIHKTYLDSPSSTSQLTYKIQWRTGYSGTVYLNRTHNDRDNANYDARTASSITVMEVAG